MRELVVETYWTKGHYSRYDEDKGKETYCLIGLANHVLEFDGMRVDLGSQEGWQLYNADDDEYVEAPDELSSERSELINAIGVAIFGDEWKPNEKRGYLVTNGDSLGSIEEWNDWQLTDRSDVVEALDRAIAFELEDNDQDVLPID
jgi:hypothetical protein